MALIPDSRDQAIQWLTAIQGQTIEQLLTDSSGQKYLTEIQTIERAWAAAFYLMPGLHPDQGDLADAVQQTIAVGIKPDEQIPHWLREYEILSGWPLNLIPLYQAAWNLYCRDLFDDDQFYNNDAQRAGARLAMIDATPKPSRPSVEDPAAQLIEAINEAIDFQLPTGEPPDHDDLARYLSKAIRSANSTQELINDLEWAASQLTNAAASIEELDAGLRQQLDTQLAE